MWGHMVEIGGIAGQPGQSDDRQPRTFFEVMQAGAVIGVLIRHQTSSGTVVRSGRIWAGCA